MGKYLWFFLAIIYLIFYFNNPALPGNNISAPLGWWEWADQSWYLKAASSTANFNFSAENFFYPPLYSSLGALFIFLSPNHPFLIIDLACFLIYAYCFIGFASRYVSFRSALFLFLFQFPFLGELRDVWIEPWTTSVVAALISFVLYQVDKYYHSSQGMEKFPQYFIFGIAAGLIFLARPIDLFSISPIFFFILFVELRKLFLGQLSQLIFYKRFILILIPMILCLIIFLIFNYYVFGTYLGNYFEAATSNGFFPKDLFEKAVSTFLDSGSLYNVPSESIFAKLKWFALSVPAIIYYLITGKPLLRLVIFVILVQLLLYLPYSDLLPSGIWRYRNIHYFKWLIPYITLLIFLFIKQLHISLKEKRLDNILILSSFLGVMILCVQFDLKDKGYVFGDINKNSQIIKIPLNDFGVVDKINIQGLEGNFETIYFHNQAKLLLDKKLMHGIRDYRFFSQRERGGIDLVFIRPVEGDKIIELDPGDLTYENDTAEQLICRIFEYRYKLGFPAWLKFNFKNPHLLLKMRMGPRYNATLQEGIDFTRPGTPRFLKYIEGLSVYEPWGRWSDTDKTKRVIFTFKEPLPKKFDLVLDVIAFGANHGKPVEINTEKGNKKGEWEGVAKYTFTVNEPDVNHVVIPIDNLNRSNELIFTVPAPVSPKGDNRNIAIGFIKLRILDK